MIYSHASLEMLIRGDVMGLILSRIKTTQCRLSVASLGRESFMLSFISRYYHWLHGQWPAGTVEKLPRIDESDNSTDMPGVYVVGDLAGVPLLKFSADTGARAIAAIMADAGFVGRSQDERDGKPVLDVAIIGGGVAGMSSAVEAAKHELNHCVFEGSEPFSTIVNFPKGKPIYTYPTDMTPAGEIQFSERSNVKEGLLDELNDLTGNWSINRMIARVEQVSRSGEHLKLDLADGEVAYAHRVIVAIGRSGNYRKLDVPGEEPDKVLNRLHDPSDYSRRKVLVVGGGDSSLEAAIALAESGCDVTISYRKPEFSRPKPDNVQRVLSLAQGEGGSADGSIQLMMGSQVEQIRDKDVVIKDAAGAEVVVENDVVFAMIGREAPLDFFRRSGISIRGEWSKMSIVGFVLFMVFCVWMYHWKAGIPPFSNLLPPAAMWKAIVDSKTTFGEMASDPTSFVGTLKISASSGGFYYGLAYSLCVVVFGIRRIRRRKTPYVKLQTICLMLIQVLPLFLLPELILPFIGHNGWFDSGGMQWVADQLFPVVSYGHGREYWRAYGFILAWPLMIWNVFSNQPLMLWLIISGVQTFVLIPLLVYRWGKGAYCGWICSCGALAETLGDAHRQKMPHGPVWNKVNMLGQVVLVFALVLLLLRIVSWIAPGLGLGNVYGNLLAGNGGFLNYKWLVDLMLAGVIGVGFYFWYSGRIWCRFACPLAALMHIYARFSQFRIFADKKKCISCNVCTSVCHQGIDVMSFANKGQAMTDPECVRCSACVQSCPTGVLTFGRLTIEGEPVHDTLVASALHKREAGR